MGIEEAIAAVVDLVASAGAETAGGAAIADTGLAAGASLAGGALADAGVAGLTAGDLGLGAMGAGGLGSGLAGAGLGADLTGGFLTGADLAGIGSGTAGSFAAGSGLDAAIGSLSAADFGLGAGTGAAGAGSWIPGAVDTAPSAGGLGTAAFDSTMASAAADAGLAGAIPVGAADYGMAGLADSFLSGGKTGAETGGIKGAITDRQNPLAGALKGAALGSLTGGAGGVGSDLLNFSAVSPQAPGPGAAVDTGGEYQQFGSPGETNVAPPSVDNPSANLSPQGETAPANVTPSNPTPGKGDLSGLASLGKSLGLVNDTGTGIGKYALPALGLGMTAMNQSKTDKALAAALGGKTPQQVLAPVAKAEASAETQKAEVSQQLMTQYQSGKLNASDAQYIQDWQTGQVAQTRAYYAKAGLSGSTMEQEAVGQLGKTAEAMREQALQNMLKTGISAAGSSTPALTSLATSQAQNDTALQRAMSDFLAASAKQSTQGAAF